MEQDQEPHVNPTCEAPPSSCYRLIVRTARPGDSAGRTTTARQQRMARSCASPFSRDDSSESCQRLTSWAAARFKLNPYVSLRASLLPALYADDVRGPK